MNEEENLDELDHLSLRSYIQQLENQINLLTKWLWVVTATIALITFRGCLEGLQ